MSSLRNVLLLLVLTTETSLAWVITGRIRGANQHQHYRRIPQASVSLHSSPPSTLSSSQTGPKQLFLYNSKTRQKEPLKLQNPDQVTMYTCGPTVYDYAHVGNFRAFLTYDLLKRALYYLGYKNIIHVLNLTDVDDKIIKRANELNVSVKELTTKYEACFLQDLERLGILPATMYPRATEHIEQMMQLILDLKDKELAYETSDGSWYFESQKMPGYGQQLVDVDFEQMKETERVSSSGDDDDDDNAKSDKKHFADFCLWKAFKPDADRMDAAWEKQGKIKLGRPGWHLECSAMALYYFKGETIDLHGGGQDLKFPHHENEIAQSEGATGHTFCNCWFHNGFVNLDSEKMSKSLGNFLTLQAACPTALDVRAYRYLVLSSQYRNPLAFTPQAVQASKNAIKRIDKLKQQIECALVDNTSPPALVESEIASQMVPSALESFEAAMVDDLSMPRAAAQLFVLVKQGEIEFKRVSKDDSASLDLVGLQAILDAMNTMDRVFGIFYAPQVDGDSSGEGSDDDMSIPSEILDLVSERTVAKDAKDWQRADSIRTQISELGFVVKDVKGGSPIITRVESE